MSVLDAPLSIYEYNEEQLQKARLYTMAYMEAKKNPMYDMNSPEIMYDWLNLYEQPLPTLLFVCIMNGILPPTKSRRDVVLAMRNHVFTIPQMAFLAFLEYTSIVRG
jgi:hypothetical protein